MHNPTKLDDYRNRAYCSRCGITTPPGECVYDHNHNVFCYACGASYDLHHASQSGKLFAYVTLNPRPSMGERLYNFTRHNRPQQTIATITTCVNVTLSVGKVTVTGHYRSNMGDRRTTFRAQLPTGAMGKLQEWYGTAYTDAGDYARLTRCKNQS